MLFFRTVFSGNFSLSESEPETVEVSSLGELKAVDEVLDNDWQLQSSVGLLATARGHLPGGAHFLQRAALADAAWPGRLPSLEQKTSSHIGLRTDTPFNTSQLKFAK